VLPSLREKHDEFMLREQVKRWANHKVMVKWLSRFFHYLDRYFIARRSLPPLNEVGLTCFRDLVYQELNGKVRDAVISLIDQEREGEQIDRALLKNVLDIFVEIGMGQMDYYENDFEAAMLKDIAAYYSRKGRYPMRTLYQALAVASMCIQEQAAALPLIGDVVTALSYLANQAYEPNGHGHRGSGDRD
ncbi:hypothetical protein H0E87_025270, partial [Populus deltoides]